MSFMKTADKYIAAKNALVAKHTIGLLNDDQKDKVSRRMIELLADRGIASARAGTFKSVMRETQYYGMAALAMACLDINPGLTGILFRDRWEQVPNPLVALTDAEEEIETASGEILRKHQVLITLSDTDKKASMMNCLPRGPGGMHQPIRTAGYPAPHPPAPVAGVPLLQEYAGSRTAPSMLITQCLKCHAFLKEKAELNAEQKVYVLKCGTCGEYVLTPREIDSLKRERARCGEHV